MNQSKPTNKVRKLAAIPEYTAIPQAVLDKGWNKALHVEGWPAAYRFFYLETSGASHLITTQYGKRYTTTRYLLYTKRYQPTP